MGLATLYWLTTLPTRKPMSSLPASLAESTRAWIFAKVALRGREQLFALMRTQLGQFRIAARHQSLAWVVR